MKRKKQFNDFSIAIIGKTNSGKSTMFNLIKKKKIAITGSQPNLTRDSVETNVSLKILILKCLIQLVFQKIIKNMYMN